jgi:hypothetical protein
LTIHERAALERAEFEDWVTTDGMPDDPPGERIRVSSLDGLVDIAADTNARSSGTSTWATTSSSATSPTTSTSRWSGRLCSQFSRPSSLRFSILAKSDAENSASSWYRFSATIDPV